MDDTNTVVDSDFALTEPASQSGSKIAWFLLGLGLGAGVTMLVLHRNSLAGSAYSVVERVKLRSNPNMV